MSKGDKRRPRSTTRQEDELRWRLATGVITFAEFEARYKKLKEKGLIKRKY